MKCVFALVVALVLGGCAAMPEMPAGVGRGTDDLKPDPCACDLFYLNGKWLG